MDQQLTEYGVRRYETGYRCPDMSRLNFLPFAPEEDLDALLNISGYSGPIRPVDRRKNSLGYIVRQHSGVLGYGTLYPGSGCTLEKLSTLFWCVKSWSLSANVFFVAPGQPDLFTDEVGKYIGTPPIFGETACYTQGAANDIKILELTDIYGSGVGANPKFSLTDPVNAQTVKQHAIPLDPINKWEELMCRNRYFSWQPPAHLESGWFTNRGRVLNSPFVMAFPTTVYEDLGDGIPMPVQGDDIYGLWSLSIMNSDFLCRHKATNINTGKFQFYTPTGVENEDRDYYFLAPPLNSGALTASGGNITGYGFHPIVSGYNPVLAYRKEFEPKESGFYEDFNPSGNHLYFPLVHFQMKFRNVANARNACSTAAYFSTVQPRSGWRQCGNFVIYDIPLTGYRPGGTPAILAPREVLRTPIYAPNATADMSLEIRLTPNSYWIDSSGAVSY